MTLRKPCVVSATCQIAAWLIRAAVYHCTFEVYCSFACIPIVCFCLQEFQHKLNKDKKVDFIEQFNEKLLVKQEGENLQIVDVQTGQLTEVSNEEFLTPTAFIFLYENQLFLTFRNRTVAVWNFKVRSSHRCLVLQLMC